MIRCKTALEGKRAPFSAHPRTGVHDRTRNTERSYVFDSEDSRGSGGGDFRGSEGEGFRGSGGESLYDLSSDSSNDSNSESLHGSRSESLHVSDCDAGSDFHEITECSVRKGPT